MSVEISKVDTILEKFIIDQPADSARGLIPSLLEIQNQFHYLPKEAIERVAERMQVPKIQVYQVAEFYKAFSLEPRGEHLVTVCLGTACHVRGSDRLIDQVGRFLNVEPGKTTADMRFTLEGVNCLGACALGPVMVVDGRVYGTMSASKVEKVLKKYMDQEVAADE